MNQIDYDANHKIVLRLFDIFLKVCQDNELKYYLAEGSCLGAIRHKGFIPWDVNIDINMTLDDYIQFDNAIRKNEFDDFVWENPSNSGRIVNWLSVKDKTNYDVVPNIDIGLICGAPSNKFKQWFISTSVYYLNKMYRLRNRSFKRKFPFNFLKCLTLLFPNKFYKNKLFRIAKKYPFEKCEYMIHLTPGAKNEARVLKKEVYLSGCTAEFEGRIINVPSRYHDYLVQFYGNDYMTPVVWEKGIPTHSKKSKRR